MAKTDVVHTSQALLAFRVSNFRSIRDEIELLLTLPSWANADRRVVREGGGNSGQRYGTVAAIYGPNASGKSNVLAAMWSMARAVTESHQRWDPESGAPHDPFILDEQHSTEPTFFEVDLLLEGERWQYGFRLNRAGIHSEWLYSYPRNRRRTRFDRGGLDLRFGQSLVGPTS